MHNQTSFPVGSGTGNTLHGASASAANGDTTAASITSDPIDLLQCITGSLHAVWTGGAPVGVITVFGTGGDYDQDRPANVTWEDITSRLPTTPPAVNGNGSWITNLADLGYRAIRFVYTRTSGGQAVGGMKVYFFGKSQS